VTKKAVAKKLAPRTTGSSKPKGKR
jgi:hypothetical protein